MEQITDGLGQPINVGSLIVYVTRFSSSINMVLARVIALDEIIPTKYDHDGTPRSGILHSQRHKPNPRTVYYPITLVRPSNGGPTRFVPDHSKAAILQVNRITENGRPVDDPTRKVRVETLQRVVVVPEEVMEHVRAEAA